MLPYHSLFLYGNRLSFVQYINQNEDFANEHNGKK